MISPRSAADSIFSEWMQRWSSSRFWIWNEGPKRSGMFSKERSRDSFRRLAWKTVETNGTAEALM